MSQGDPLLAEPILRAATAADVADVRRIVAESYAPYIARIGRQPAPMSVDYRLLITTTDQVRVLVDGPDVVGLVVTVEQAGHLFVETVAVAPGAQGRGFGRRLLDDVDDRAHRLGLAQIRLYTNAAMTENLAMYPRLGYERVDRRTVDGYDRVFFVKNLSTPSAS